MGILGKNTIPTALAPYPLHGKPKASNHPQSLSNDVRRSPISFDGARGQAGCPCSHQWIRQEPLMVELFQVPLTLPMGSERQRIVPNHRRMMADDTRHHSTARGAKGGAHTFTGGSDRSR